MGPEGSMSQINSYVVLDKSHLFDKKARLGTGRVDRALAPGIPGAAIASNGRRNVARVREIIKKVREGDGWDCRQMYS